MDVTSLEEGSTRWRAARVSVILGAWLRREAAADDLLGWLAPLGDAPGGWWSALGKVSAAGSVHLVLPRPGDPRGLLLPRLVDCDAAVGWRGAGGSSWLIPRDPAEWEVLEVSAPPPALPDPGEARRQLRTRVVEAAHALDLAGQGPSPRAASGRRDAEAAVDAWVLGAPPLPGASRDLAVTGLRMLLALNASADMPEVDALEIAARTAVEVAYSAHAPGR